MVCIDCVSTWQKCLDKSASLEDLHHGGRVSVVEECIAISNERFVRCAVVLVLHLTLGLAPGAKGLVELYSLFEEARSADAGEYFPYALAEYCPIFYRRFWKV